MRKTFLISTALVGLAAGSAMAADLPVYRAAPVVAVPGCAQFGSFYLGGHVGWKYRDHDWKDKDNYGFDHTFLDHIGDGSESVNSWEAGLQTGYNLQFHCTVLGLQADWSWTDAKVDNYFTETTPFPGTYAYSSKEKWFGTLRSRTGVVVDNVLLYLTGGLAWANFDRNHI